MKGMLIEWTPASHGIIMSASGERVYANAADFPRNRVVEVGQSVSFELADERLPPGQLPSARRVILVVK